ncbi:MAG TPA: hypothetical protein VLS44_06715, partial [Nitrospira sp.]|nr:hypothetical protein [Nitrospira sp.]
GPLSAEEETRLIATWFAREVLAGNSSEKPALSAADMKDRLLGTIVVEEAALRLLAQERAQRIREWLTQQGRIEETRIYLVEAAVAEGTGATVPTDLKITAH